MTADKAKRPREVRRPVPVPANSTAMGIIIDTLRQSQPVNIALLSYIEGRSMPGKYVLHIEKAVMVPMDEPAAPTDNQK